MFPTLLQQIASGSLTPREQQEDGASHCKKIAKEDGEITPTDDPILLDRKYRAYTPWPGLFFYAQKNSSSIRVKITAAHYSDGVFTIDEVVPENGKKMPYSIFVSSL